MPKTIPALLDLQERMQDVRNFLDDGRPFHELLSESSEIALVDDVGAILLAGIVPGHHAHIHICFWDGRLRGRERLLAAYADDRIAAYNLKAIGTGIPSKYSAVLAFARRAGMEVVADKSGVCALVYWRRNGTEQPSVRLDRRHPTAIIATDADTS